VGSKPAGKGRWGHTELVGNVAEWTLDWYREGYPTPCADCAVVGIDCTDLIYGAGTLHCISQQQPST